MCILAFTEWLDLQVLCPCPMSMHEQGCIHTVKQMGTCESRSCRRRLRGRPMYALNRVKSMHTWTRGQRCAHVLQRQQQCENATSLAFYQEHVECLISGLVHFHVDNDVVESWQTIYQCVEPLLCYKAFMRQSFDNRIEFLKTTVRLFSVYKTVCFCFSNAL